MINCDYDYLLIIKDVIDKFLDILSMAYIRRYVVYYNTTYFNNISNIVFNH